jgi:hypothetical protein
MRDRDRFCKTCLVDHDEEIHAATESIHQWLRERLKERLNDGSVEGEPAEAA